MNRYKIFMGSNGYYVAWESPDGFHHAPYDNGSALGFDLDAAEQELEEKEASAQADEEDSESPWWP